MEEMAADKTRFEKLIAAGKNIFGIESKDEISMNSVESQKSQALSSAMFSLPFDGEKNSGEVGPIIDYYLQYDELRLRSWQSYIESEVTQTVFGKFTKWIVGSGLKLQSEPVKEIFDQEKIDFDIDNFAKNVEARFQLFAKSKLADYCGNDSLNSIAKTTYINAKVGGDVLVILRLINGMVKVQLVDGVHVKSKQWGYDLMPKKLSNGNFLKNGIETNERGEIIAYHVMKANYETQRILAKTRSGLTQAFMVYGFRYRLHNNRGIPLISVVLEALKKMDRYKEATIGSAEERQKIAYYIYHGMTSTGENPFQSKQLAKSFDSDLNLDHPKDINGKELANTIAASTNKQVFNMPNDSELKQLESKNELHFKDFYSVNIGLICSCIGIPPEVAMSKYDSNFSASRAALKDWEHTILIERENFREQFYSNIYNFWLEVNILQNNVNAPGYLTSGKNSIIKQAYQNSRFIGAGVPHIDPLKEVKAEREKLGPAGKNIPLTTVQNATESLNTGDSDQNLKKFAQEFDAFNSSGIKVPEVQENQNGDGDGNGNTE